MAEQNPDSTTTEKVVIEKDGEDDVVITNPVGVDMMGSTRDEGGTNMEGRQHVSGANDTSGDEAGVVRVKDEPHGDDEVFPGTGGDSAPSASPDPEDIPEEDHSRESEGIREQPPKADVELDTAANEENTDDEEVEPPTEEPNDEPTDEELADTSDGVKDDPEVPDTSGEPLPESTDTETLQTIEVEGPVVDGPSSTFPPAADTEGE